MTLKDKKNKREYNQKLKAQGGIKENDKINNGSKDKTKGQKSASSKPEKEPTPPSTSNFEGVAEDAEKLISDANRRYLDAESKEDTVDPKYANVILLVIGQSMSFHLLMMRRRWINQ